MASRLDTKARQRRALLCDVATPGENCSPKSGESFPLPPPPGGAIHHHSQRRTERGHRPTQN
jgi:hypothetical protein